MTYPDTAALARRLVLVNSEDETSDWFEGQRLITIGWLGKLLTKRSDDALPFLLELRVLVAIVTVRCGCARGAGTIDAYLPEWCAVARRELRGRR